MIGCILILHLSYKKAYASFDHHLHTPVTNIKITSKAHKQKLLEKYWISERTRKMEPSSIKTRGRGVYLKCARLKGDKLPSHLQRRLMIPQLLYCPVCIRVGVSIFWSRIALAVLALPVIPLSVLFPCTAVIPTLILLFPAFILLFHLQ